MNFSGLIYWNDFEIIRTGIMKESGLRYLGPEQEIIQD